MAEKGDGKQRNVFLLGLTSFFTDVSSEMIFPILPIFLTSVLKANMAVVGLVEGIAESSAALFKLLSGYISDRFGRKKPLVIAGYGLSTLTKPLLFFATSWLHVLAVRVADRFGKGVRDAPRDAMLAASVEEKKFGSSFGLHRMMDTSGAIVGTLISFFILQRFIGDAFKLIFALSLIPGILAILVLWLGVREVKTAESRKLSLSFNALESGLRKLLIVIGFFGLANFSYAFFLLRAQNIGIQISMLPLIYLVHTIFYAAFSIPAGRLADRFGRKNVFLVGLLIFSLTSLGFGFLATPLTIWALFAVYGIFMAVTQTVARAYVSSLASEDKRGFALGAYNAVIGLAVFPANFIGGLLWNSIGVSAPFVFSAIFSLLSALLLVFLAPKKQGKL
jgi:MFS family permease